MRHYVQELSPAAVADPQAAATDMRSRKHCLACSQVSLSVNRHKQSPVARLLKILPASCNEAIDAAWCALQRQLPVLYFPTPSDWQRNA